MVETALVKGDHRPEEREREREALGGEIFLDSKLKKEEKNKIK